MTWYQYLSCFFAGAFLANFVPHFVHGISGNRFPSPFSKPPGKGLSSPLVNVLWSLLNLVAGYILLRTGQATPSNTLSIILLFAGIIAISIPSSIRFAEKHTA
ncbi:MAG: hypothetical protein WA414_12350 [Acidobacteriaceae bacterium]